MSKYYVRKNYTAKEMARANISKSSKRKNGGFFSTIRFIFIMSCACALAGVASLELYLSSLPPINNLEQFKPNIVTKIYSSCMASACGFLIGNSIYLIYYFI